MIAVVEDDPKIAALLRDYLVQSSFDALTFSTAAELRAVFPTLTIETFLLDVMLPDEDGFSLCEFIRRSSNAPILFISARISEADRLRGLELGADDYIIKPFSPNEVIARVKANLKRYQSTQLSTDQATGPQLTLDRSALRVCLGALCADLTAVECALLGALMSSPDRLFARNQLMDVIYTDGRIVSDRTIDSHVKKLRKRLASIGQESCIDTTYGVGYRYRPSTKTS